MNVVLKIKEFLEDTLERSFLIEDSDGEVMANLWEKLMGRPMINNNSDKENNQNLQNKLDQFYYNAKQFGIKENRLISTEDIQNKKMDKIYSCFRYLKALKKVQKQRKEDGNKSVLNIINANVSVNMTQTALQIQQENNYLVDELTKKVRNLEKENFLLKNENKELVDLKEINKECENLKKKINEIETDKEKKYKELEEEYKQLEYKYENVKSSGLIKSTDLIKVKGNINSLKESLNIMRNEIIENTKNLNIYIKSMGNEISTSIICFKKIISKKDEKIAREMEKSKKYYNEIQELRGNIRVYCRIKPSLKPSNSSTTINNSKCVYSSDYSIVNLCTKKSNNNNISNVYDYTYEYDYVFSENSKQEEVFEEVKPLVMLSLDGYNSCIFAYGETGSGKTYTMEGYENNYGIIYRTFELLFNEKRIKEESNDNKIKINYRMYMVEIYNETVRDLLNDLKPLEIHQNSDGSVYLRDVMKKEINNYEEVINIMKMGNKNRSTNSTNSNEHSSRSHMLLFIEIETINKYINNKTKISNLTLIDLAGSERVSKSGVSGDRLKEAQNINKSLSCLGDVIESLQQKQQHIPYRNSKLTYLLKNNLSKDNKVLMFVMINNDFNDVSETKCSLTFASRVRSVELGSSKDYKSNKEIKELKEEIKMLRNGLKELENSKITCERLKCDNKDVE